MYLGRQTSHGLALTSPFSMGGENRIEMYANDPFSVGDIQTLGSFGSERNGKGGVCVCM